ncbi:MAG: hypothetical protein ACLTT4_00840 [Coprobacillus cateniformis]|jgi:hypothetical protein
MSYYERIASFTKKELLKEVKRNMEKLDSLKVSYKRGKNYQQLKKNAHIKNLNIEDMNGDQLYLLCVQLDSFICNEQIKGE